MPKMMCLSRIMGSSGSCIRKTIRDMILFPGEWSPEDFREFLNEGKFRSQIEFIPRSLVLPAPRRPSFITPVDMLEKWTPDDFRKFFDEEKLRSSQLNYDSNIQNLSYILCLFLDYEVTERSKEIIGILLENGADPMWCELPSGSTLALKAFKQSDVDVAVMFLNRMKDINARLDYCYGERAIHVITRYQDESFCRIFLSYNPDLDVQDELGQTALHIAAKESNYRKIKILADRGANVTYKDHFGTTPLHRVMASYRPQVLQTIKILLDNDADPWEHDDFEVSPIKKFIEKHESFPTEYHFKILKTIIEHDTTINRRDVLGNSFLHVLASHGSCWPYCSSFEGFLNFLLDNGADPNLVNDSSETIIDLYMVRIHRLRGHCLIKNLLLKSLEKKIHLGSTLLRSIESNKDYAEFLKSCKAALSNYECSSFYGTKQFTLLDVLTATSTQELVRYVKHKDFAEMMATFDVGNHPYGHALKKKFELGCERYEAEMKVIQYLSSGGWMNFECLERIVQCLPIEELKRIQEGAAD